VDLQMFLGVDRIYISGHSNSVKTTKTPEVIKLGLFDKNGFDPPKTQTQWNSGFSNRVGKSLCWEKHGGDILVIMDFYHW